MFPLFFNQYKSCDIREMVKHWWKSYSSFLSRFSSTLITPRKVGVISYTCFIAGPILSKYLTVQNRETWSKGSNISHKTNK